MDPYVVTDEEIGRLGSGIRFSLPSDDLAALVHQSPFGPEKRQRWTRDNRKYVRRAGYCLVLLAVKAGDDSISEGEMLAHLDTIRHEIHDSSNWSGEMLNDVPVAVGQVHPGLFDAAFGTAKAYGKIDVFHGDNTNRTIVDAVHELQYPKPKRKSRKNPV